MLQKGWRHHSLSVTVHGDLAKHLKESSKTLGTTGHHLGQILLALGDELLRENPELFQHGQRTLTKYLQPRRYRKATRPVGPSQASSRDEPGSPGLSEHS